MFKEKKRIGNELKIFLSTTDNDPDNNDNDDDDDDKNLHFWNLCSGPGIVLKLEFLNPSTTDTWS